MKPLRFTATPAEQAAGPAAAQDLDPAVATVVVTASAAASASRAAPNGANTQELPSWTRLDLGELPGAGGAAQRGGVGDPGVPK